MSSSSKRLCFRLGIVGAFFVGHIVADPCDSNAQEFEILPAPPEAITSQQEAASEPQFQDRAEDFSDTIDESGVETLVRGPLHEAFAEPIMADPAPGLIINREPPKEINEVPPDFQPDGDRATWISGYWGWDDQREDFIWISGVYRIPPDGHRWVPGYWLTVDNGWQWVQGFWISDTEESIEYLPAPPASLEVGPSSPAPGPDYFYVPGAWSDSASALAPSVQWNPGYWHPIQDDFIWIPSHSVWTPRGCIYVTGYWDRRLPLRGLCFAPVYIPRSTYEVTSWRWRPTVVLNSQVVLHNLFVQPGYNHYVFGDYYGVPFSNSSTVPAYLYHQRRGNFDPLISFYTAYNARQGHDLYRWYGSQFAELSRNPSKRPPHAFHSAHDSGKGRSHPSNTAFSDFAYPLNMLSKLEGAPRIAPVSPTTKQEFKTRDSERKQLATDRRTLERQPGGSERSPLVNRPNDLGDSKNVRSLRLPLLPNFDRMEPKSLDAFPKRPVPPRGMVAERPSSRPTESDRPLRLNQLTEKNQTPGRILSFDRNQPKAQLGNTLPDLAERSRSSAPQFQSEMFRQGGRISPPVPPKASTPSNQVRPTSGERLGLGNLNPNPTRSAPTARNVDPNRSPTKAFEPKRTPTNTIEPNRSSKAGPRPKIEIPPLVKPNASGESKAFGGRKNSENGDKPRGGRTPSSEGNGPRDRKGK